MTNSEPKTFREEAAAFYADFSADSAAQPVRLGLGTATIGREADDAALKQFQQTMDDAYTAGIRYIDTSAQYGGSEYRVGEFLGRTDRASVFIATKSPVPAVLTPREAALHVRQGLRNSLERLAVEHIDLFQIHDVERLDQVLAPGGILEMLLEAKQVGLIRYFGLATRFHHLLETAVRHGAFDTILTYSDFTPAQQSARSLIRLAAAQAVGVINGSPLAFGLFTGPDPRMNRQLSAEQLRQAQTAGKLFDFCRVRGLPLLALAMQYPLQNPDINITLTGPGSPDELRATLSAVRRELPADIWQQMEAETDIAIPA